MLVGVALGDEADPHASNKLSEVENILGSVIERTHVLSVTLAELVVEDVGDLDEVRSSDLRSFTTVSISISRT